MKDNEGTRNFETVQKKPAPQKSNKNNDCSNKNKRHITILWRCKESMRKNGKIDEKIAWSCVFFLHFFLEKGIIELTSMSSLLRVKCRWTGRCQRTKENGALVFCGARARPLHRKTGFAWQIFPLADLLFRRFFIL